MLYYEELICYVKEIKSACVAQYFKMNPPSWNGVWEILHKINFKNIWIKIYPVKNNVENLEVKQGWF